MPLSLSRIALGALLALAGGALVVGLTYSAYRICLTISPDPLHVIVSLVTGDKNTGTIPCDITDGLQHGSRTYHIGSDGIKRLLVGSRNNGLCSKMKDKVRLYSLNIITHLLFITDVTIMVMDSVG